MLATVVTELAPALQRRVEKGMAELGRVPGPLMRQKLPWLITALADALQRGQVPSKVRPPGPDFDFDTESFLLVVRLLREGLFELLEERAVSVSARELRVVSDWFLGLTEKALREEQSRFTALLDAVPDPMALHDRDGRPVYVNRAAQKELLDAATICGGPGEHPGDKVELLEELRRHNAADIHRVLGGETVRCEVRYPSHDGWRWREHTMAPVRGSDNAVAGAVFASRDVHDRKTMEEGLKLLSKLGNLGGTTDYEGVLAAVAQLAIPELCDWCLIDVVDNGVVRRGTVAHRDPDKAAFATELLQLPPFVGQTRLGDEAILGHSLINVNITDEELRQRCSSPEAYRLVTALAPRSVLIVPFVVLGKTVAIGQFFMSKESGRRHRRGDLTLAEELARRAAQLIENARLHEELQKSEARFRFALDHSDIVVFEDGPDLKLRWIYPAPPGFTAEEMIGKRVTQLLPPAVAESLEKLELRLLATGERQRSEVQWVHDDGQTRWVLVNYEAIREPDGSISGLTGSAVDITEAKRAQEELARALVFREQMIGVLGHDLRNPLTAVHGLAGLLRMQPELPDRVREGLVRIDQAARRMIEMTATLLDFTQSRFRGGLPIAPAEMDLDGVCRGVIDELRIAHPGREIRVISEGDLHGHWDPARMAQVVSNLVGNALTHGDGSAPIEVVLRADEDDDEVAVAVSNRGEPIPETLAERIFEPFQQGDREGRVRGLGLGLFIVQQIVAAHGGRVSVRSTAADTCFTVRLKRRSHGESDAAPLSS